MSIVKCFIQRANNALEFVMAVRNVDIEMRGRLALAHGHEPVEDPEAFYSTPPVCILGNIECIYQINCPISARGPPLENVS